MEEVQIFNKLELSKKTGKKLPISKSPKYGGFFLDHDGKYYRAFCYTGKNFLLISKHLSKVLKAGCKFKLNKDDSIHVTRSDGVNHCMVIPKGSFLVHEAINDLDSKKSHHFCFNQKFKVLNKKYFSGKASIMTEHSVVFNDKYIW